MKKIIVSLALALAAVLGTAKTASASSHPTTINVGPTGGWLIRLHWKSSTHATGSLWRNNCKPSCARGSLVYAGSVTATPHKRRIFFHDRYGTGTAHQTRWGWYAS